MFSLSHFLFFDFWSLMATKLWKYYVIFVYILQRKIGKTWKNRKGNHATKVTKIPKTKTKIWDERNINSMKIADKSVEK